MTTQTNTTLVEAAIERVKIAFWASLTNANAGMKWLDHDSMEEMISAAWVGFEEPIIAALSPDEEKVERAINAAAEKLMWEPAKHHRDYARAAINSLGTGE